jgi:hypothetical protein
MFGLRQRPSIDRDVPNCHGHHEQRTQDQRRSRRRDSKRTASEAQCECEHNTDQRFHSRLISMIVFPGGNRWSAATKPTVIASSRQAPIRRGGAGDGISKSRHPPPTIRPRRSPMITAIIFLSSICETVATEIPRMVWVPEFPAPRSSKLYRSRVLHLSSWLRDVAAILLNR